MSNELDDPSPPVQEVFICEPRGAVKDQRYLVALVKQRSMRIFRTPHLWVATEVRDTWGRGFFNFHPGELRRLPNPKLCVMTP